MQSALKTKTPTSQGRKTKP